MGLSFFGLTSNNDEKLKEIKLSIYRQIHQICFHGKGGYSWPVVYNMPVYLRNFVYNEIKQFYEEQEESSKNSSNSTTKTIVPGTPQKTTSNPQIPRIPKVPQVKKPPRVKYR